MSSSKISCVECSTALPGDANFCFGCGTKVQLVSLCRTCKSALLESAKFCHKCGASGCLEEAGPLETNQLNKHLDKKIGELKLSVRSTNALRRVNIIYIGDLIQMPDSEMLRIGNLGRKSLAEIKSALVPLGLNLGSDIPDWHRNSIKDAAEQSIFIEENPVLSINEELHQPSTSSVTAVCVKPLVQNPMPRYEAKRVTTKEDFRLARKELGISSVKLAEMLRMGKGSDRTIRRYESGNTPIPGPVTVALEALLSGFRPEPMLSKLHDSEEVYSDVS
jgi:hypothetical protein